MFEIHIEVVSFTGERQCQSIPDIAEQLISLADNKQTVE